MFPNVHIYYNTSAKLQIVYRINMSKTTVLDTFTINFKVFTYYMYCTLYMYVWLVAILSQIPLSTQKSCCALKRKFWICCRNYRYV